MIDLLTAIQTKWNTTTALTNLLPSLYYDLAPANTPKPSARIVHLSGTTAYETTNGVSQPAFETCLFQFDVFTDTSVADADIWNHQALQAIDSAYNLKALSLSYDYFLSAVRQGVPRVLRESETTWHGIIIFAFTVVRQI